MALYQASKTLWYLPLNGNPVEAVRGLTWTVTGGISYVPELAGSGVYIPTGSGGDVRFVYSTPGVYPNASGVECKRLFAVMWQSGYTAGNNSNLIWLCGANDVASQKGFQLIEAGTTNSYNLNLRSYNGGELKISSSTFTSGTNTDWNFIALYGDIGGGKGSGFISFNGGPWSLVCSGALLDTTFSVPYAQFYKYRANGPYRWDEMAMWGDVDQPTRADLQRMYAMGKAGAPLSQFDTWVDLSLYPSGACLQPDKVVLYHPMDTDYEWLQNVAWTGSANTRLGTSPVLGNALFDNDALPASKLYADSSHAAYPEVQTNDTLTTAFWVSGLVPGGLATVGWGGADPINGLGISGVSPGVAKVVGYANGVSFVAQTGINIPTSDPFLVVIDGRTIINMTDCWVSINGADWQHAGNGASQWGGTGGADTAQVGVRLDGAPLAVDEVVVWRNVTQFTAGELANLYALGATRKERMARYYNTPTYTATGSMTAAMPNIYASASGTMPAAIPKSHVSISGTTPVSIPAVYAKSSGVMTVAIPGPVAIASGIMPVAIPTAYAIITGTANAAIPKASAPATCSLNAVIPLAHVRASGTMLAAIPNTVGRITGLLGLVVKTAASPSAGGFTIENLLRTADHYPQIIGKLDCASPDQVQIEVWSCSQSGVSLVSLKADRCYPIGDTGRWGWSTENMSQPEHGSRPTFLYRMVATNAKEFKGQFLLHTTSDMPGSVRRARRGHR